MSVSLIVPWRPGDAQREHVWAWCKRYWEYRCPEFELVECDSGDEPFTRGRSVNEGVEKSSGEILVLADADTLVPYIGGAVERAVLYDEWLVGYRAGDYYKLTETATAVLLNRGADWTLIEPVREDWAERLATHSACVVLSRAAFERVGGYDPRFIGWGFEDGGFLCALETLFKPHERARGWAIHLWHAERDEERFGQPHAAGNRALYLRYQVAYGNVSAMRALVRER